MLQRYVAAPCTVPTPVCFLDAAALLEWHHELVFAARAMLFMCLATKGCCHLLTPALHMHAHCVMSRLGRP